MVSSQAPTSVRNMVMYQLSNLPGPKGDMENEAYVALLKDRCDGIAMFDYQGALLYGWSQDQMNLWYWFADFDANTLKSCHSYEYVQSDGSKLFIESESHVVRQFMNDEVDYLMFNGSKFYLARKDVGEDGITYYVMGGADGRGLHVAVSPDKYYMLVVAANATGLPTEYFMGIQPHRTEGEIKRNLRELNVEFKQFAKGALGV